MMSLKKIKKKKFILKHFNKKIIKSTSEVQEIELNENQTLFIKGEFEFIVLNATITLDLFQIKHHMIYHFNNQNFVNLSCHCNSISIEEFMIKFQEQPLTETYTKFVNYMIKYKPNKPTLLVVGSIISKKSGYFIDETKEKIFKQNPKSIMFLGEKGAGKSISLQQYANKKLNKESVFILDTDLGQSISLPGFVTLLKLSMPSFLQSPQVIYQGFVGEFSVQNHISLYFNKIGQAVLAYNEAQLMRDYPLLINTAGFVTNYGITIIQELISIIQPQNCLILAHSNQKGQIIKAETLKQQLPQISFFNSSISYTPDIQILIEDIQFDEEQKQTIFNQRNPQMKKNNRIEKIALNLGLNSLNYIELSLAIPQVISLDICKFIVINEKYQFYDIQTIAQVFLASLVAIETEDNFIGLGYVKDIDIAKNQIHIISKAQITQNIYLIKSKYFDCQIDTYYEIKLEEVYQTIDEINISLGTPLESAYELPFLNVKCDVIGDRRQIVKINKKKL